jgi:hypothetical protein
MGELGPSNANDIMNPRPLLAALEATQTIALAWSWQCGQDKNSLLTNACDPTTPNDAGNGGWGSLFKNFTNAPRPAMGCSTALGYVCGATRGDVFQCVQCAGSHQQTLRGAGCDNTSMAVWCSGQESAVA